MPFIILDIQLLVQGVLYFTAVIIALAVSIPLGITENNFGGNCVLYAGIEWKNATYFDFTLTDYHNCNFGIYLQVICGVLYGAAMTVYHGYALTRKDPNIGSQMWVMPFILFNAMLTCVVFISSCMISVGFKTLCDNLLSGVSKGSNIKKCADGQDAKVDWNKKGTDFYTHSYYTLLSACQAATWVSFLVWTVQVALCILRFVRNRRLRSKDQYHDPPPSVDAPAGHKKPEDLENFAATNPTA